MFIPHLSQHTSPNCYWVFSTTRYTYT